MRFLCNSVELEEQFSLRYLVVEKFEESITDVLERRDFSRIKAGIPPCNGSIEENVNSTIFDASTSAVVRCCVEWLACHVDTKRRCVIQHRGHPYNVDTGMT